jgi:hypothetical protein
MALIIIIKKKTLKLEAQFMQGQAASQISLTIVHLRRKNI